MWVSVHLKCPEDGDRLAITRVTPDGDVTPEGYLPPSCIPLIADTLRELHAKVAEEGHNSAVTVAAWEDFVNWADNAFDTAPRREPDGPQLHKDRPQP